MKKNIGIWLVMLALVLTAFGSVTAEEVQSWEVSVGKSTADTSLDSMFPKVIYIHEGDSITFNNEAAFTPHTVTFLAGSSPLSPEDPKNLAPNVASGGSWDGASLLNSGLLEPGKSYNLTFTKSGAYGYYCILHPLMTGTVVVLPKEAKIPSKVEQAAASKAQYDDLVAQAEALKSANHNGVETTNNGDGTFTYQVKAGLGLHGFSTNRMFPETIFISEGDQVEWFNDNHYEIHFITFNKPEDMQMFTPQGLNPAFFAPAGGPEFDGTGFVNSGVMMAGAKYKLTFTKAGSYQYECYLHSGEKMVGTVVVAPKNTVKVLVNGKPLVYDYKLPHMHNNQVYVGIVAFFEALGGKVTWDASLSAVVATTGGDHALPKELQKNSGLKVIVNGKQLLYGFEPGPHSHDGRSFAPVQELVKVLGGSYSWDEATQTLSVNVTAQNETGTHSE